MSARFLYLFWGAMDLFYIGQVCYFNFSQSRIPVYSDVQSFLSLEEEHGAVSVLLFSVSLFLMVSTVFSMLLFFRGARMAPCLAYAQVPFRIIFAVPSLPFLLW
ncbi:arginine:ornithine antiporter, partial [Pseudomonas gingeri]